MLLQACEAGDYAAVERLDRYHWRPDLLDDSGNTMLHAAVKSGNAKVVECLATQWQFRNLLSVKNAVRGQLLRLDSSPRVGVFLVLFLLVFA